MLRLRAGSFYEVTSIILQLQSLINHRTERLRAENDSAEVERIETEPVLDPVRKGVLYKRAEQLIEHLEVLGTRVTMLSAKKMLDAVSRPRGFTWSELAGLCEEIRSRLADELSLVHVYVLEENKAALFNSLESQFGVEVAAKFQTEGVFEIDEAAKCLALARPTACVFHIMRVLEIGIKAMCACLSVPDPVKPSERNWGRLLQNIQSAIRAKWPTAADRAHEDCHVFESLYASLDAVKNPWRNATMHVENKYTDDEAEHIFVAVRGFMMRLASRCDENGCPKA